MIKCKECKYWVKYREHSPKKGLGYCVHSASHSTTGKNIMDSDTARHTLLTTGPNYGCINAKQEKGDE